MKYLLDTHVWLWSIVARSRIRPEICELLERESAQLFLSTASVWEMAIKYQLGKLPLPEHPRTFVEPRLARDRVSPLPIVNRHVVQVADLPPHHNDPFDRLLVAQAQVEGLILVTADDKLDAYDVALLRA